MCKFKSAIYHREKGLLHDDYTDSHEDLVAFYNLDDNTDLSSFVRVEFYPDDGDYCDVEKYTLHIDEQATPIWFDDVKRQDCINGLTAIIKRAIIKDKKIKCLLSGLYILCGKTEVWYIKNSRIFQMRDSSVVETMRGSSVVEEMRDSSVVKTMMDSSVVKTMMDSSVVEVMRDSSVVETMWDSSVVKAMWGSSVVKAMWGSSVVETMWDSSVVKTMWDSSVVKTMRDSSVVKTMRDSSVVETMRGSSVVEVMRESSQVRRDIRVKKSN